MNTMHTRLIRRHQPLALAVALALGAGSVHAAAITVTNGGDSGSMSTCTLRQAIDSANTDNASSSNCTAGVGADSIVFDSSLQNSTISLSSSSLQISSSLTINGSGQTIDGAGNYRDMLINTAISSDVVGLSDLTLTNDDTTNDNGGGLAVYYSTVTLTNVTLSRNTAKYGAGLFVYASTVTLTNSNVSGNTAAYSGGGIYSSNSQLTLTNSNVSSNTAAYSGGGIYSYSSQLTLTNSSVSGNTAAYSGGGIYSDSSQLTLTNSNVSANTAANSSGGIYSSNSQLTLTNSNVSGNTAASSGGGILSYSSQLTLTNSNVSGNTAASSGGGIYSSNYRGNSQLTLTNSSVSGNQASSLAGGIYTRYTQIEISDSTIADNQINTRDSHGAGGIYLFNSGQPATLSNSTISGNTITSDNGTSPSFDLTGGLYSSGSSLVSLINCTVTGNTASGADHIAGGISESHKSSHTGYALSLVNTTVFANSAISTDSGSHVSGGLLIGAHDTGSATLQNSIVAGNTGATDANIVVENGSASASYSLLGSSLYSSYKGNYNLFSDSPDLAALADNGGPTQSMALLAGSPAIDVGNNGLIPTSVLYDQRGAGFPRIQNGTVDMGSFEFAAATPIMSTVPVPSSSLWSKGLLGLLLGLFATLVLPIRRRRHT